MNELMGRFVCFLCTLFSVTVVVGDGPIQRFRLEAREGVIEEFHDGIYLTSAALPGDRKSDRRVYNPDSTFAQHGNAIRIASPNRSGSAANASELRRYWSVDVSQIPPRVIVRDTQDDYSSWSIYIEKSSPSGNHQVKIRNRHPDLKDLWLAWTNDAESANTEDRPVRLRKLVLVKDGEWMLSYRPFSEGGK